MHHIHAFVETQETLDALRLAFQAASLAGRQPEYMQGGMAAAHDRYLRETSPALLIIETGLGAQDILDALDALAEACEPHTHLLLLGRANDVGLYRRLIQKGVRDYLPLPADPATLAQSIAEVMAPAADNAPKGKLIAAFGATGGAGSSTVSANLAFALAKKQRTALIDFDLAFGQIGLAYDQESATPVNALLAQPERLDGMLIDGIAAKREGQDLLLLTASASLEGADLAQGAAVRKLIDSAARNASAVVADLPHVWLPWTRETLGIADEVVIVAPPTLVGLRNARNILESLKAARLGKSQPVLIVNGAGANPKTEVEKTHFQKAADGAPLHILAFDPASFQAAMNNGEMLAQRFPKHKAVALFEELAMTLAPAKVKAKSAERAPGFSLDALFRKAKA